MSISQKSVRVVVFTTVLIVTAVVFGGFVFFAPAEAAGDPDRSTTKGNSSSATEAPDAVFPANGGTLGAIADGAAGGTACGDFGAPRDITFTVSGMSAPLSDVRVSITGTHTWVGDLDISLIAPGGAPTALILSQTGSTTVAGCGDSSDLAGPYNFFDTAPSSPTWWGAATTAASTVPVASGNYRTTSIGGVASGGGLTLLTPSFAGLSAGQINGTWVLRVRDGGEGDTGSITAATLTLSSSAINVQHVADYDGDGTTDYVVARNTGGGPSGQITWFVGPHTGGFSAQPWGIATDFFLAGGDYDGDHKTDITVWRPGTQGFFYILQSSNNTLRSVPFGITGDDPTVDGDYTGDGKTDPAVYRAGANTGDRSYWYYLASSGPLNGQVVVTQWGQNGDFPAPGDYNGDHKNDFCVQRNAGGGSAVFYEHDGTGGPDVAGPTTATFWGFPTDVIVPGDYDGDGKTDIAVTRGSGGALNWYIRNSSDGSFTGLQWGLSASDYQAQGDYDGDGRTDVAIWRPSLNAGETAYYYKGTTSGIGARQWGQNGDYPVANYNTH